jgi:hypothetical protein
MTTIGELRAQAEGQQEVTANASRLLRESVAREIEQIIQQLQGVNAAVAATLLEVSKEQDKLACTALTSASTLRTAIAEAKSLATAVFRMKDMIESGTAQIRQLTQRETAAPVEQEAKSSLHWIWQTVLIASLAGTVCLLIMMGMLKNDAAISRAVLRSEISIATGDLRREVASMKEFKATHRLGKQIEDNWHRLTLEQQNWVSQSLLMPSNGR